MTLDEIAKELNTSKRITCCHNEYARYYLTRNGLVMVLEQTCFGTKLKWIYGRLNVLNGVRFCYL
uniref:hypothetical protein n=1 Tax=Clostridium sp. NkU-1 TaxID=1095009 RepID=UPI000A7914E7